MARTPLFNTLANTQKKALSCRCCGIKEFILLFAIALWSFALIVIPKRIAQAHGQGGNPWNEVGKPRVIAQPEIELAADCAARRGGPVLVVEALTSDEWTDLSAEDFESRYIRASKPVVVRDALAGTDAMGMWDSDEHLSINFGKWKVDVKQEGVAGSESKTLEWFLKRYKASAGKLHLTQRMTKRMASQVILPEVFCGVVEHGLRQDVQLSMTSGSHKGPIHCDSEDALLMQFDGSKTVYLADPGGIFFFNDARLVLFVLVLLKWKAARTPSSCITFPHPSPLREKEGFTWISLNGERAFVYLTCFSRRRYVPDILKPSKSRRDPTAAAPFTTSPSPT